MKYIKYICFIIVITLICLAAFFSIYKTEDAVPLPMVDNQEKYKGKKFTNNVGMEFVWIEPGTFMMGSPEEDQSRGSDETLHKVKISKGFYMQTTEVTQKQWRKVMGGNPSNLKDDDLPVRKVSWNDAILFITALNYLAKGYNYRLPTEAEWEYSCRAGTESKFSWGDTIDCSRANYGNSVYTDECKKENYRKIIPVKSYTPNPWGLYDMHGNVWEWCEDNYSDYGDNFAIDPKGLYIEYGFKVLRGGSWYDVPYMLRTAKRIRRDPKSRKDDAGFRVVIM